MKPSLKLIFNSIFSAISNFLAKANIELQKENLAIPILNFIAPLDRGSLILRFLS